MASRFVELNEAASLLGITPEELVERRSNGDIHGYRDGTSWKFKIEEVERCRAEWQDGGKPESSLRFDDVLGDEGLGDDLLGEDAPGDAKALAGDDLDDLLPPDSADEEAGSILVEDVGEVAPQTTSSTIIGKSGGPPAADSDLKLAAESEIQIEPADIGSELSLDDAGSEISLDAGAGKKGSSVDSDVALIPGVGTDSDVKLVAETGSDKALKTPPGLGAEVLGDSDVQLQSGSAGGTGPTPSGGSGTNAGLASGSQLGSDDLEIALDSELALSEDDEMVLGSGAGSDFALNAADSGINLSSPTDSGLSLEADSGISLQTPTDSGLNLEEDMAMGDSSISSLELPEDESIELDAGAFDGEPAQNLKKDEDFLLTPSDEMFTDESDSGSQVIALEDSVAFDQDVSALDEAPGALLADSAGLDQQLDSLGGGGVAATPLGGRAAYAVGPPEAPHSVWTITGLLLIMMFLSITGVMMSDMLRNMWAWDDGMDVATSISEGVTAAFGMK